LTRRVHLSRDVEKLLLLEAYWLVVRGDVPQVFEGKGLALQHGAFLRDASRAF